MKHEIRIAQYDDLEEVSAIEKATMGNYTYVDTAWNYFMNSEGAFLCAYDNGTMVGIAHVAILPDGCGWFEALRVHPDHQNQGVGKALYEKAMDLVENRYHCPTFSMYTGPRNVRSASLAEKYGLTNTHEFREYFYNVTEGRESHDFRYADWREAEQLVLPLKDEYAGFLSVNRTMYRINEVNVRALADQGHFYQCDGTVIGVGSRFQHGNKLFISVMKGDYEKAIDFAVALAKVRNIPQITCTFSSVNEELEMALKDYGFEFLADLITKERTY